MSGPAEQWAWQLQDERLSLSEKFVLVYLARRAYYDDGCGAWPSVNTIAAHLPLHAPFRAACVEALAGAGLLARGATRSWPRALPAATSPSPEAIAPRCGTW